VSEQLAAFSSPMSIVLKGVLCLTKTQFRRNTDWIVTVLADVILCNDRAIRILVKDILDKHCNPFLIIASKLLPSGAEDTDDL